MLTVIDMLTGFTIAVPIKNKNAETICDAYRDNIYCVFGGSSRILMDNGSEFKNKEMHEVCDSLGLKHIFSPVYTPQSDDCTGIRTGNDAQLRERESANDTHHAHCKTTGSRPGASIDQNFTFGVTTHFRQVH